MKQKYIDRAKYEEAYKCARKVYTGDMRVTDAREHLRELGLNPNSALDFVYIFQHMLRGEVYKRAMSVEATEDFLMWIRRDYDDAHFRNALIALGEHIRYRRIPLKGHRAILAKYENEQMNMPKAKTALDDLDVQPIGNILPDKAKRISFVIERDENVRTFVIKRANGKCEFCGCEEFKLPGGQRYVEAHHIIALAKAGSDTVQDVIALCANHHREAHYGEDAEKLESKFIQRLAELNK
ncbi:MAG TPA: HNH endonuclease signature motif containing protein [Opitutales bacterium]|jgi:hypothetical protein|nr:HNH endonuclease signature motif containing protein [Opitutales bacterium]